MKLIDLAFYPNAPIKTLDGYGILSGIPNFNSKSNIVRVTFSKIKSKPNCLDCGKLQEFWNSVDYGYYNLNSQNKIILKDLLHLTLEDAIKLGYDISIFSLEFIRRNLHEKSLMNGFTSDEFKKLCFLHYDLFRWIDKDIALSNSKFNLVKS